MIRRQQPKRTARTILIIENDVSNRLLVERILEVSGYRHISAPNGQEALQMLDTRCVDLILTDLSMPVLDGFSTARLIRDRPEFRHTPIVAITAHTYADERQKALRMGCSAVLVKPYRPKELLDLIERLLALPNSDLPTSEAQCR